MNGVIWLDLINGEENYNCTDICIHDVVTIYNINIGMHKCTSISLQYDNGWHIIYQVYRIRFVSLNWDEGTPKNFTSACDRFVNNFHSNCKFEKWWYQNWHNPTSRYVSDPEVDNFN